LRSCESIEWVRLCWSGDDYKDPKCEIFGGGVTRKLLQFLDVCISGHLLFLSPKEWLGPAERGTAASFPMYIHHWCCLFSIVTLISIFSTYVYWSKLANMQIGSSCHAFAHLSIYWNLIHNSPSLDTCTESLSADLWWRFLFFPIFSIAYHNGPTGQSQAYFPGTVSYMQRRVLE
jgi:hypothetical protein